MLKSRDFKTGIDIEGQKFSRVTVLPSAMVEDFDSFRSEIETNGRVVFAGDFKNEVLTIILGTDIHMDLAFELGLPAAEYPKLYGIIQKTPQGEIFCKHNLEGYLESLGVASDKAAEIKKSVIDKIKLLVKLDFNFE